MAPLLVIGIVGCAIGHVVLAALGVRGRFLAHFGDRRCRLVHGLAAAIGVVLATNAVAAPLIATSAGGSPWEPMLALAIASSPAILVAVPNLLLLALFWKVLGGPSDPE